MFLLFQKAFFFYKVVNCTQITAVEKELHNLLPGKKTQLQTEWMIMISNNVNATVEIYFWDRNVMCYQKENLSLNVAFLWLPTKVHKERKRTNQKKKKTSSGLPFAK